MKKIAHAVPAGKPRKLTLVNPYLPPKPRTVEHPLDVLDEAIGHLRIVAKIFWAEDGDRDAIHVLVRETENLQALLATLEQVRDHLVVQVTARAPK